MFETFTAVFVLVVFLIPGYIWRVVENQFVYLDHRLEWEKFALGLLTRSISIYLPYALLLYQTELDRRYLSHPFAITYAFAALILILPVSLGWLAGRIRQQELIPQFLAWLNVPAFAPTAWDAVFSNFPHYWIIVTLKNGKEVQGYLDESSRFSSDPEDRDLYISDVLEEGKSEIVPGAHSIYIKADEISTIDLIRPKS